MRREFLKKLLGTMVGGIVLKEIPLLEIPRGREFVSLYSPSSKIITYSDIVARELEIVRATLPVLFDRDDVFYTTMISGKPLKKNLEITFK